MLIVLVVLSLFVYLYRGLSAFSLVTMPEHTICIEFNIRLVVARLCRTGSLFSIELAMLPSRLGEYRDRIAESSTYLVDRFRVAVVAPIQ